MVALVAQAVGLVVSSAVAAEKLAVVVVARQAWAVAKALGAAAVADSETSNSDSPCNRH